MAQDALVKVSNLVEGWEVAKGSKTKKHSGFFTYLGRQVKEWGLHHLEKLTDRLALGLKTFQRRRPFLENAAPQLPELLAGTIG